MRTWQLWREDKAAVAARLERGEDLGGHNSAFGDNDLIIGFLMVEGFWNVLVDTQADKLKKDNGYLPRILNGLWALCELAGVERIARSGKVLGDEALLRMVGFQAEEIDEARAQGRLRVDTETLSNHLSRISETSVQRSWWNHVKLLKSKRWYRGGVYAVDGTMITIPYGQSENYEGAENVGNARGYKLVVVLNIESGQERVIGWALGGLARSEKTLLRKILQGLREQFGRLGDWMKVLVMDRGYWGAQLLAGLKDNDGVDYVTRAGNDELDLVKDMEGLSRMDTTKWHEVDEEHSHLGKIRTRMAGFDTVPLRDADGQRWGYCRAVIADEYDCKGNRIPDRPRFYYVTSFSVDSTKSDSVAAVRQYYRRRWSVENQGFWILTKRWNLNTLAARNLNAIRARLNFALQLYNAENCCTWKHPGSYDEELHRLKRPPQGERLGRPSIMIYTPKGQVGAFQVNEYTRLLRTAIERAAKNSAKAELKVSVCRALKEGKNIEDILRDL